MNYCVKCLKSEANCKCPNQWHPAVSADQLTEAPMYMEVRCPECDRLRAESAAWNKRAVVAEAELALMEKKLIYIDAAAKGIHVPDKYDSPQAETVRHCRKLLNETTAELAAAREQIASLKRCWQDAESHLCEEQAELAKLKEVENAD